MTICRIIANGAADASGAKSEDKDKVVEGSPEVRGPLGIISIWFLYLAAMRLHWYWPSSLSMWFCVWRMAILRQSFITLYTSKVGKHRCWAYSCLAMAVDANLDNVKPGWREGGRLCEYLRLLCALQGPTAPFACWKAERVAADLDLSRRLAVNLDAEKGIAQGPFAEQAPSATEGQQPELQY